MSNIGRGYDINQTFVIEPAGDSIPIISACTSVYSNELLSCSGNTNIILGTGVISFDGNLYTNDELTASTINASTFYSGGTNLINIIELSSITGGTFNSNTDTLTLYKNSGNVNITGFTDYYTTGATLIGNTVYFDRNDLLSAYTVNLSSLVVNDIYVTGVTFSNNNLLIVRNDGVRLNTFINTFTGLTINGLLQASTISATTISASTFYGDGSNLTGISTQDTSITGGSYNQSTGIASFTNNTGGTFTVSGFTTPFTGGTINSLTANTISATTYQGLPIDIRVTGGTYSNNTGQTTFTNNTGGTFNVSGYFKTSDDIFTSGLTFNTGNYDLILSRNDGNSFTVNLGILSSDVTITGGTYNPNTGVATFVNNTGGTFQVSGFLTGHTDTYVTAMTFTNNVLTLKQTQGNNDVTQLINYLSGLTVTGDVIANSISATTYQNLPISGLTAGANIAITGSNGNYTILFTGTTGSNFTGGTVTGATLFTAGLSANTFSATTYFGLPIDVFTTGATKSGNIATFTNNTGGTFTLTGLSDTFVTGGTYNSGTGIATFTNNTGGTFTVNGFSTGGGTFTGGTVTGPTIFTAGLSANTISATTYQNLPQEVFVTGATYSNNRFTYTNNTGGTFNVLFNTLTGLTINGNLTTTGTTSSSVITGTTLTIAGTSNLNGTISASTLTGTTSRMVEVSSTGIISASTSIISAYLVSGSTAANLLETTTNWDINGVYTGTTITGTYQGQKHYNNNYLFEAVADNLFIRLIRG